MQVSVECLVVVDVFLCEFLEDGLVCDVGYCECQMIVGVVIVCMLNLFEVLDDIVGWCVIVYLCQFVFWMIFDCFVVMLV